MTKNKKNFEGVGIPEQAKAQTPTEFFIGATPEEHKEEQKQASIYMKPIAVNCITNTPTPILSYEDAQELKENNLNYDKEAFTKMFYNGDYTDLPIIQTKEELDLFYKRLETNSILDNLSNFLEENQEEIEQVKKPKEELSSYTLKAPKELLESFKLLAMIKKTTIKDLIIKALYQYLEANQEDYKKAKAFLELYLK